MELPVETLVILRRIAYSRKSSQIDIVRWLIRTATTKDIKPLPNGPEMGRISIQLNKQDREKLGKLAQAGNLTMTAVLKRLIHSSTQRKRR